MYKVTGAITSIGEVKQLDSGAKVVDYTLTHVSENGYSTIYNIGFYKGEQYAEHVDNFVKYNKVGDLVDVEFTIRSTEYNGKIYNNLNHWKVTKVGTTGTVETPQEEDNSLPF